MSQSEKQSDGAKTEEPVSLRQIAALIRQIPLFPCLEFPDRNEILARIGLSPDQTRAVHELLSATHFRHTVDLDDLVLAPPEHCPINWRPTILTPVFWGRGLFEPDDCLPVPLRVYYPSLDGAVQNAPILDLCGQYPLILFLHGHCLTEDNHVYRWERTLAQLARSGFVVAAPYNSTIGSGPQQDIAFHNAKAVMRWMRRDWAYRNLLSPAPAVGVAGHSYGSMLAARIATSESVGAYASLSAGWHEWSTYGSLPIPLFDLKVPSFHCWGTEGLSSDAISDASFAKIAQPKHKVVLDGGEHWAYLQGQTGGCSPTPGGCPLLGAVAGDLLAGFFAKYLPPSELALTGAAIPNSLVTPEIDLTFQQEFYAGGHLSGLDLLPYSDSCQITSTWATPANSGTVTLASA